MEDERITQLMARKLAGEATAAELAELDHLLATRPEFLFQAELLQQLWQKGEQPAETGDSYQQHRRRFADDFDAPAEEEPAPRRRYRKMVVALAGMAALLALFAGIRMYRGQDAAPLASRAEVAVKNGSRSSLLLPDGSRVWLNAGSKLVYDYNMNQAGERLVQLEGEAFFDVAKKADRPFIIKTGKISIRVLGTSLNVKAYPADKITEATLITGKIEVNIDDKPEQRIVLAPMEKFVLEEGPAAAANKPAKNAHQYLVGNIRPVFEEQDSVIYTETAWVRNQLVFNNETLEELAPRLERWYNIVIVINNQNAKKYRFTGIFDKETVEQAFRAMQLIKSFSYAIEGNVVTIN
ncbi:FecR family protein [Chitinophaga lutea]|nr:FecR domain-containing protein [Chitinophaga lutea]